jgi:hypothetical protein
MHFVPQTGTRRDSLQPMVENNPLINFHGKQKAKIVAAMGFSVSQQLVRVVLKTPGYTRQKESQFNYGHLPPKTKLQHSWSLANGMKHSDFDLFCK